MDAMSAKKDNTAYGKYAPRKVRTHESEKDALGKVGGSVSAEQPSRITCFKRHASFKGSYTSIRLLC
jgi:hypothetical protein